MPLEVIEQDKKQFRKQQNFFSRINYLGTYTMRKTGVYWVYMQSNYNIKLVMQIYTQSSEAMTLTYLYV